jgi:2-keto-3-deoxy-L-rhamnonate aldolase RhmA
VITQLDVFVRGIDVNFNTTGDIAALMPMQGTTTGADLYDSVQKVLQSLDIPTEKAAGMVTDGEPSTVLRNSGVSSLIINHKKNTTNRDMKTRHYLVDQETLCEIPQNERYSCFKTP